MYTYAVLYKFETCNFCGFCGQLVILEIFILEILLVKIWLVAIGEQGMCEETFDICMQLLRKGQKGFILSTLSNILLNEWAVNNLTTVYIFFLSINHSTML